MEIDKILTKEQQEAVAAAHAEDVIVPDWMPPACPKGWQVHSRLNDGASYRNTTRKLAVVVSAAFEADHQAWVHLSVSHVNRIPTWGELRSVKDLFLGDSTYAYQIFPDKKHYINIHPNVLHLFCCLSGPQLPEFSRHTGSL